MGDQDREATREQLLHEVAELRQRLAALEASEAAVRQTQQALEKARGELEKRVQERTADLANANEQLKREIDQRERVKQAARRKQQLLEDSLTVHDLDRKLLAYEIHDGLAQQLTGAMFLFQSCREQHDRDPEKGWETFDAGLRLLDQGIAETRRLISGLRPPILEESGVVAAIEHLIGQMQKRGGPQIEFLHEVQFDRLAVPLESALFRIVQESLTNARRHSKSPKIQVKLVQSGHTVRVEVRDWGIGFNPKRVKKDRFGLEGIRKRTELLGGHAAIETGPDEGTCVTVDLPLVEQALNGAE